MRICLIADRPDHPVLGAAMVILAPRHETRVLLAGGLSDAAARRRELGRPADTYLLKSRSAAALELGAELAARGAAVINDPAATALCLDRAAMAERVEQAGLPHPRTVAFDRLVDITARDHGLRFPLMLKSRHSRRGDLVMKVPAASDTASLLDDWAREPVIAQEFQTGDGYDAKLWAIGAHLEGARRRTPLETGATGAAKRNLPLDPSVMVELERLGRAVGAAFGLQLYGVDVIMSAEGPSIVDVNAFPGFRGVEGAPGLLADLVETSRAAAPIP
jgi:ribosomal protein S6--L-glutamate ligase